MMGPGAAAADPAHAAMDPGTAAVADPAHAAMDPAHPVADPAHAAMDPAHAVADLAHAAMDPAHAVADPAHAAIDPAHAVADPAHAVMDPAHAAMDPAHAVADPAHAAADPGTAAVADPAHGHNHDKLAGSQWQTGSQDGSACSIEGSPSSLPDGGGGSSGRAGSVHVCADCGGAPSAGAKLKPAGAACPCATARQSARRSTGRRVATRRHALSCMMTGRVGRLPGGEASSVSPCGCMDVGLAVSVDDTLKYYPPTVLPYYRTTMY